MVAYSFQRQFVTPIQVGLGLQQTIPGTVYVPKRQTIRAVGKRRHARPGETLQLYRGMRTRQCFKIGDARCVEAGEIELVFGARPSVLIRGETRAEVVTHFVSSPDGLDDFARADGFADWAAMVAFWVEQHGPLREFFGVIVYWEPLS